LAQQNGAIAVIIINNVAEDGPVNGGGENMKKLLSRNIIIIRKWKLLLERMSNGEEVFGRLIDRGPATNLINRDGI
jgi:hypothetical protein